ncbi:MAG: multicopper oxidase family protein [Candidatus Tumulicola sp.]
MRRLLVFIGVTVFAIALGACASSGGSGAMVPQNSAARFDGQGNGSTELTEPPEVRAVHGVATVSLVAQINVATELPAFDFKGQISTAPTIRVRPGDTIVLDVTNELPAGHGMQGDLNLHFHGLGVSPEPPADDVLTMLAMPGGSLHYVVPIPKVQEPGLYWYHPHVHGQVNFQVGEAGMSGAIVITGLEHHLPGLAKLKERLLVVRDRGLGDTDMAQVRPRDINPNPCGPDPGLTLTVNDAVHPFIPIAPGESQFFRLVNATGHKNLKLAIDGGTLEVVAIDGVALDAYPGTPPTETVSSLIVPPAGRAEFVVTGGAAEARFRTLCFDSGTHGDPDPMEILASLRPPSQSGFAHGTFARTQPHRLTVGAPLSPNPFSEPLPPVAAKRVVVLSEGASHMFINGKAFSMKAPPMFIVRVGTVEEWRVSNVTDEVHDFHIHQTHFFVESVNGVPVQHPHWADSVVVPHRKVAKDGSSTPGHLVLLMDFRNPIIRGEFVFHCHILDHEDSGMMAKILAI